MRVCASFSYLHAPHIPVTVRRSCIMRMPSNTAARGLLPPTVMLLFVFVLFVLFVLFILFTIAALCLWNLNCGFARTSLCVNANFARYWDECGCGYIWFWFLINIIIILIIKLNYKLIFCLLFIFSYIDTSRYIVFFRMTNAILEIVLSHVR